MSYVIYNKGSTWIHRSKQGNVKYYKTMAAAKAALTRLSKSWYDDVYCVTPSVHRSSDPLFTMGIAEYAYFINNIEKTVTRQNLMSGKNYQERVNTPSFCSPSSDAYWD